MSTRASGSEQSSPGKNRTNTDAMAAAKAAKAILIERHKSEWEELLGVERLARGLTRKPIPTGKSAAFLLQQLEKLEAREAKIRRELAARGVEPE